MKTRLLILATFAFSSLFMVHQADALIETLALEDLAEKAEFVVIGDVIEITPLVPRYLVFFTDGYDKFLFDVTLSVEDDLDGKYGQDTITFRIHDSRENFGMHIEDAQHFEIGERVLVFIGKKEPDSEMGNAYLVHGVTQGKYLLQDGIAFGTDFPEGIDEDELISKIKDIRLVESFAGDSPDSTCKSGPLPGENFVFFDCNWVKIPYGWIFENGMWQEDPNIQRIGPQPLPSCPRIDICTCSGEYSYYNSTDQQCHSSPYIPTEYEKLCKQYEQIEFDGWQFNAKYCDWIPSSDPYENEESMRLASEKVEVGGLGIDPVFDESTIIIGILIGVGSGIGLMYYWRIRK